MENVRLLRHSFSRWLLDAGIGSLGQTIGEMHMEWPDLINCSVLSKVAYLAE
jgi:hypothetical protein